MVKASSTLILLFLSYCQALEQNFIKRVIQEYNKNLNIQLNDTVFSEFGASLRRLPERRLPQLTGSDLNHLTNYGCYCNFNSMKLGFGNPVDYIDHSCKNLFTNYLCIYEQFACDVDELTYAVGMIYFHQAMALSWKISGRMDLANSFLDNAYDLCESLNENSDCKISICKSEIKFVFDILPEGLYTSDSSDAQLLPSKNPDGFYSSDYEEYDDSQCRLPRRRTPREPVLQCCQEAPNYVRYNTQRRACCNNVIYDLFNADCQNGSVVSLFV